MTNSNMLKKASTFLKERSLSKSNYTNGYKDKSDKMLMFERLHSKEYKEWLALVNLNKLGLPKDKTPTFFYFANYINTNLDVFIKFIIDNKLNKSDYLKYYKDRIKYVYSEVAKKEVKDIKDKYTKKYKSRVDYIHEEYINNIKLSRKAMHEFLVREWPKKEKERDGKIALVLYKYKDLINYLIYTLRNKINLAQGKSKLEVISKYESKKDFDESIRDYREKLMEVYTGVKNLKLSKEYRDAHAARSREARRAKNKEALIDTSNEAAKIQKSKSNKKKMIRRAFIDKALDKLKKKKGV